MSIMKYLIWCYVFMRFIYFEIKNTNILKNTQLLIVKKIIIQIYFMRRGNHVYLYSDFRQEQIVRLQASW